MTGGPNSVLHLAIGAAKQGVPVRFFSCYEDPDADFAHLRRHITALTGVSTDSIDLELSPSCPGRNTFDIGPHDAFCATHWITSYIASKGCELTERDDFLYVIQDFEPGFYPWSPEHAMALQSYELNFVPIVNEATLLHYFRKHAIGRFASGGLDSKTTLFEPAVDRSFMFPRPCGDDGKRRLIFYARPSWPRFLYDVGLAALRSVINEGLFTAEQWELISLGEPLPNIPLGNNVVLKNKRWLTYPEYAALFRTSDIVLSLTLSPHTSYPPLEGAACGARVVTNTFDTKSLEALTALSHNIDAAPPTPRTIASALRRAHDAVNGGLARNDDLSLPHDWQSAVAAPVEVIHHFVGS
jgi:hypothetical protein